jgi:hypothetical protein
VVVAAVVAVWAAANEPGAATTFSSAIWTQKTAHRPHRLRAPQRHLARRGKSPCLIAASMLPEIKYPSDATCHRYSAIALAPDIPKHNFVHHANLNLPPECVIIGRF